MIKSEINPVSLSSEDRLCGYILCAVIYIPQMANRPAKFRRGVLGYCMAIDQEKNKLTSSKAKCLTYAGKLRPCYINVTLLRNNICVPAFGFSQTSGKKHFLKSHVQTYPLRPLSGCWQLSGARGGSGLRWLWQDSHPKGTWVVGQAPTGKVLPWPP